MLRTGISITGFVNKWKSGIPIIVFALTSKAIAPQQDLVRFARRQQLPPAKDFLCMISWPPPSNAMQILNAWNSSKAYFFQNILVDDGKVPPPCAGPHCVKTKKIVPIVLQYPPFSFFYVLLVVVLRRASWLVVSRRHRMSPEEPILPPTFHQKPQLHSHSPPRTCCRWK